MKVALQRLIPLTVFSALCLCAVGPAAPALGAPVARADAHHTPARQAARAHRSPCVKRSGHHSSSGRVHRARLGAVCRKRNFGVHHTAGAPGKPSHPAKARGRPRRPAKEPVLSGYAPIPPAPAAADGRCPDAALAPDANDLNRIRAAVLCLVNRERTDRRESPLAPDARIQQAAQAHTESMAFENYFEHVGPRGETPLSRMRATGYIYSSHIGYELGENIGWGTLWQATPHAIVAAWMASPEHRANILDARFRNTGIGVSPHPPSSLAHHRRGAIYTQDFGVLITR